MNETPFRILIIDDDLDLLMLLERSLIREGYDVETAVSLVEAEEMLLLHSPHLVLLDINVNGEDGRTFCWKLKKGEEPQAARVILMSGYDPDKARAALFGADDVLAKPLHLPYLLHLIEQGRTSATSERIYDVNE
jgi:DNA-binding response OmpR family regulator